MKRYTQKDMVDGEKRARNGAAACEDARRQAVAHSDSRARVDHFVVVEQIQIQRAEAFAIGASILRKLEDLDGGSIVNPLWGPT